MAHIQAGLIPEATNRRFLICQGQITAQEVANVLRAIPALKERTPVGNPKGNQIRVGTYSIDTIPSKEILGLDYRSPRERLWRWQSRCLCLRGMRLD
jgi:hypothetical protein